MSDAAKRARRKISRATFWSYAGAWCDRVVRFATFVLIARLLDPTEFGIAAIGALVIAVLNGLLEAGLGQVLIRRDVLSEEELDSAFWTSLALGAAIAALVLAGAGPCAVLFREPMVQPVLEVLAVVPLIRSAGLVHRARIVRRMGFRALAGRTLIASLVAGAAGWGLAAAGWGVWALVVQALVAAATRTAVAWSVGRWVPGRHWRWTDLRPLLPDSVRLTASQLVNLVHTRGFDLAAGLVLGTAALATLRIAGATVLLLIETTAGPLTLVAFAALSRHRNDPEVAAQTFSRLARHSALLMYPAFLGAVAVSHELLPLVFGAQWTGSGLIMPVLCLVVLPIHFQLLLMAALFAAGRTDRMLHWQLAQAAATIPAGIAGARYGLYGIAAAATFHMYALIPLGVRWLRRDAGVDPMLLVRATLPALLAALAMAAVVFGVKLALAPQLSGLALLAALVATGIATYAMLLPLIAGDLVSEGLALVRRRPLPE